MSAYVLSPEADADLFSIWSYLAKQVSVATADRIDQELYATFESLGQTPGQGRCRSDLTREAVLFFAVYQFLIFYRVSNPLQIVAVLHGRRNVARILKQRSI